MIPILGTVLGTVLDSVIDKITNNIPVTQTEKENIKLQAEKELSNHAGTIAQAEAAISSNAKDTWLEELHNGGFFATSWRPLLALSSTFMLFWDGVILSVINHFLSVPIAPVPANISEVSMWILLTLIGARGIEKISVVSNKGK